MDILKNVSLDKFTSFGVGGEAEEYTQTQNSEELEEILKYVSPDKELWLLGYGSNSLISDSGLPGLTVRQVEGNLVVDSQSIIVDSGVWWDDVVKASIDNDLWGIELLSEVPGSVGAGLVINIAAYGQSIGERVNWVEAWDRKKQHVVRFGKEDLDWDYKISTFQQPEAKHLVVLRASIELSKQTTQKLEYQKALDVAAELQLNPDNLQQRRQIIIEARKRAGSLWNPSKREARTVGSFFRNPLVSPRQVEAIISFDESGLSAEQITKMNLVHSGSSQRVSAAHVMLASGFQRGQSWGTVKLNDLNLLKVEALEGASASSIYAVMLEIQNRCQQATAVWLEPEVSLLGKF